MKKKIYIAGRISGLPLNNVFEKFKRVESAVIDLGYEPVNPLTVNGILSIEDAQNHVRQPWHTYLRNDIAALVRCDCILLMEDWCESKGATLERDIAIKVQLEMFFIRGGKMYDNNYYFISRLF